MQEGCMGLEGVAWGCKRVAWGCKGGCKALEPTRPRLLPLAAPDELGVGQGL